MATGTQRRVIVVLGEITQPPPMPATSSVGAIHQPTDVGGATRTITAVADMPSTHQRQADDRQRAAPTA